MLEPFSTHFCESPEEEKVATTRWYEKRETTDDFVRSTREKLARAQSSRPWPWRSSKATLHKSDGSLHSHEQFQAAAMPPGHILEEHNCSKSKGSSRLESLKLSLHLRDDAPWNTFQALNQASCIITFAAVEEVQNFKIVKPENVVIQIIMTVMMNICQFDFT